MSAPGSPGRPSDLLRALGAGRGQGSLLAARGNPTLGPAFAPRAEVEAALGEVEAALGAGPDLWTREWCATQIRAALRLAPGDAAVTARGDALLARLLALDEPEFEPLRDRVARGEYGPAALLADLEARPAYLWDPFVQRLLGVQRVPERETERPSGMVHYLPSSVRTTLALARRLDPGDVFFDVGSGLGLVTLLVAWISGARAVGLEYEPTYHRLAVARAERLRIPRVRFELGDARHADLSEGTVFYVYDTFRGQILDDMITRLEAEARERTIRVISRGHSTPVFDGVAWLAREAPAEEGFVVYRSRPAGA